MRRLLVPLILLLLAVPAAAPAATPGAGLSADGRAAVAFLGQADVVDVWLGSPSGFGQAIPIAPAGQVIGTAALPGGGARVITLVTGYDYNQTAPTLDFAVLSTYIDPNGVAYPPTAAAPLSDDPPAVRFAANANGDVLIAWQNGYAFGSGAGDMRIVDAPGTSFAPAVAPNGAMLLAGATQYLERAPGTDAFNAPVATGPELGAVGAALDADGAAVITGVSGGKVVARLRQGGGAFGQPVALGDAPAGMPSTSAAIGGGRVAVGWAAPAPHVAELTVDGKVEKTQAYGGQGTPVFALNDQGAGLAGLPGAVAVRDPGATFGAAQGVGAAGVATVARTANDYLIAGAIGDGLTSPFRVSVGVNGNGFPLRTYPLPGSGRPTAVVPDQPLRVVKRRAVVPVRCLAGGCKGTVNGRGFSAPAGGSRVVRVPVARRARALTLNVTVEGGDARRLRLELDRSKLRSRCRLPADAVSVGRRDEYEVALLTRNPPATTVYACAPRRKTRVLIPQATVLAAGANREKAVVATRSFDGGVLRITAKLYDLRTGDARDVDLPYGQVITSGPITIDAGRSGGFAFTEKAGDRVRVRMVDSRGDRVVDARPGVDATSLAVYGDVASWRRGNRLIHVKLR